MSVLWPKRINCGNPAFMSHRFAEIRSQELLKKLSCKGCANHLPVAAT
jgi:hypothetical protein